MSAWIAGGGRKTAGEDAAFEEAANFPFDVRRNGLTVPIRLPRQLQIGYQPFRHDLIRGVRSGRRLR